MAMGHLKPARGMSLHFQAVPFSRVNKALDCKCAPPLPLVSERSTPFPGAAAGPSLAMPFSPVLTFNGRVLGPVPKWALLGPK